MSWESDDNMQWWFISRDDDDKALVNIIAGVRCRISVEGVGVSRRLNMSSLNDLLEEERLGEVICPMDVDVNVLLFNGPGPGLSRNGLVRFNAWFDVSD